MNADEPRARIGQRRSAVSRAKNLAVKALLIIGGVVMLTGAFVVSVVLLVIGLTVVLTFGGYLWWRTRELRRRLREQMQGEPRSTGEVIEGEVISHEETRR